MLSLRDLVVTRPGPLCRAFAIKRASLCSWRWRLNFFICPIPSPRLREEGEGRCQSLTLSVRACPLAVCGEVGEARGERRRCAGGDLQPQIKFADQLVVVELGH